MPITIGALRESAAAGVGNRLVLLGARTGVGRAVEGLLGALPAVAPDVEIVRYELQSGPKRRGLRP